MKYYFVTYQNTNGGLLHTHLISKHPLEYQKNLQRENIYPNVYCVVWWTELSKKEYEKYKNEN